MDKYTTISKVTVEGLHGQFDSEINLEPGLNIIYGKNGRGKTTLLHLLANVLELDFSRFSHIAFNRIEIKTSNNNILEVRKEKQSSLKIFINESATSYGDSNAILSEAETDKIREAIGGRPTYLPAFRSILERTRIDTSGLYREMQRKEQNFDEIVKNEVISLQSLSLNDIQRSGYSRRKLQEEAVSTAEKTSLCRQWFGRFVPVIRYPSVADVEDGLSEEWRRAQLEITSGEQRMFEETFVTIFRSISGLEELPKVGDFQSLVTQITNLLTDQESKVPTYEETGIYDRLRDAVSSINPEKITLREIDNSFLVIYAKALEARNMERRSAFQKSRDFEASINKFLDKKKLTIGQSEERSNMRSFVQVTTEGGQTYGLSSLSSGERQILTMLYSASRTKFLSGPFLVDEPELSLHIDWQRIILQELLNQSPNRQIIACTHSPEVGADHLFVTQDFEPKKTHHGQNTLYSEEDI
jgi:predicted ATP-dependent endonuclease of OLD family